MLAKEIFLAKNLIFEFCLILSNGIYGGMKTVYFIGLSRFSTELSTKTPIFRFASKKLFSGKTFDFRILLITFKRHHNRYENRFILTFYPISVPNYLQKTPKIRFACQNFFFLVKHLTLKFCLLLSRSIAGGMKIVYFIVLSRLSTELSTKTPIFRFASKTLFSGKTFDFRILLITFKRHHRRYENRFILSFYPISVPNYLQKHPNFVLLAKHYYFWQKFDFRILLMPFKRHHRKYENRFILTFYPVSVPNYLQKTPKIRFASQKKFFLTKNLIFKFCLFLSRDSTGGMRTDYLLWSIPSQSRFIYKKTHQNFVLLAKHYFFWQKN